MPVSRTPTGKRRLSPEERRRRDKATRAAGWGKLHADDPFATRTSVKARRVRDAQEDRETHERCVRVGTLSPDYTGQSMSSRPGYRYCMSKSQWAKLQPGVRLGCGSFGCAYERPDGTVLKVTTDPSDIAALKAGQGHKRIVRMDEAYRLTPRYQKGEAPSDEPLFYAAVVQRVDRQRVPGPVQCFIHGARTHKHLLREAYEGSMYKGNRQYRVPPVFKREFTDGVCKSRKGGSEYKPCVAFARDVIRVHEHLGKRGFNFFDVHPGNIGVDAKGTWKFLDVGYSSDTKRPKGTRVLAGARRRR